MNIFETKIGDKVRYHGAGEDDLEKTKNANSGLVEGAVYTIDRIDIDNWHTTVYLTEFRGEGFNSVMFENVFDDDMPAA